jgi:BMFP domain-containing protein YqiC
MDTDIIITPGEKIEKLEKRVSKLEDALKRPTRKNEDDPDFDIEAPAIEYVRYI